jgi:hypothetical protein
MGDTDWLCMFKAMKGIDGVKGHLRVKLHLDELSADKWEAKRLNLRFKTPQNVEIKAGLLFENKQKAQQTMEYLNWMHQQSFIKKTERIQNWFAAH